jgi:hypothetical protein
MNKSYITFAVFLLLIFHSSVVFSQEWNSARISVLSGNSIPFYFNSLDKIKKGIEVVQGTKLGITLTSNNVVDHDLTGFNLNFRSYNNQPFIKGDVYTLPLDRIRLRAASALGLESGVSEGYVPLSIDWLPLFTYQNETWTDLSWNTHQLYISYDCGIPVSAGGNGNLLGEEPDYYLVEIEIEIFPTGPGF